MRRSCILLQDERAAGTRDITGGSANNECPTRVDPVHDAERGLAAPTSARQIALRECGELSLAEEPPCVRGSTERRHELGQHLGAIRRTVECRRSGDVSRNADVDAE